MGIEKLKKRLNTPTEEWGKNKKDVSKLSGIEKLRKRVNTPTEEWGIFTRSAPEKSVDPVLPDALQREPAEPTKQNQNISLGKQILNSMNKNTQAAKASDRIKTIGTRPDLFQPNAYRLDVSEISDLSRLEKELENQQKLKEQFGKKLESYAWAVPHQETANTIPYERDRDNRDYQTIVSNIDQLNRKKDILKRQQNKAGLERGVREVTDYADVARSFYATKKLQYTNTYVEYNQVYG